MVKFWIVITLFFTSLTSQAQSRSMEVGRGRIFQARASNPSVEAQRTILQELLSSETPELKWPAFPRTWTQMGESSFQETSTSLGLTVNAISQNLGLGALTSTVQLGVNYRPHNFVYRYTYETNLVVLTSYRGTNVASNEVLEATGLDLHVLFEYDPVLNKNFFKATHDSPMVGFCSVEARLEINISEELGISYLVGESKNSTGTGRSLRHALYSNFFQIEPHIPISEYLETYCGGEFKKYARPFVEADFNKLVLEMNVHNNPRNECVMEGGEDPQGDNDCLAWFQEFSDTIKKVTVPRCVMGQAGVSRCELRSKKEKSCPLFLDSKGRYTEKFDQYSEATSGFSFPCDNGLSCSMKSNPLKLGRAIFWPGYATCH